MKLRVWWIPQIPGTPFYVAVDSVAEGVKLMDVLADYDKFQLEHHIKPDYSNGGGLQMFDLDDDTDGPDGSWVDWWGGDTDDPREYLEHTK